MICATEQITGLILSSLKELDTRRSSATKALIMDAGCGRTFFLGTTHEPTKKEGAMVSARQHQIERAKKRVQLCFHAENPHKETNLFHT